MSTTLDTDRGLWIAAAPLLDLRAELQRWEASTRRFAPQATSLAIIRNVVTELDRAIERGRTMRRFLSVAEAADEYGVSERQIRNLIKAKTLRADKVGGVWRIAASQSPRAA